MRALHKKGPQAYLLTLPLTLPQGTTGQRAGKGQGLETPPPPLPSRKRRGLVLTAPCQLQGAPMAGRPDGCLWRRWGKTTTSPCRIGRRVQGTVLGTRGLHKAARGGQQVEAGQSWGQGQGSGRQRWGPAWLLGSRGNGGSCHRLPLTEAPPGAMRTPPHRWPGIQRVGAGQGSGQGSEGRWRGPVGLPREQWRRGFGGGPPLTGASSAAQGNPSRKVPAPPRRLDGRASSEVT